ncbi:MAG: ABC transporter ATP-binding protein [Pseudotabrizicola sp.]|uniref:ABC transporter ATP-binding protein n=1 Tax=Pseudotabrizicola sp. TaxID=2939647 RepID=UPI0027277D91|nr:ABC transporter ATP-binding protein [Pseudotabrizicola sp.]MDO8883194.1 ABC transporter ATP-binding protein [Pseudotabrizicola sp.]MDP2080615.1 ABC transporter ATP-binding protein [Pseudotabrizicola sp.]MDZ7573344.1 ABC transporter ATP-binding protein [Pseudotabrizicola sp.]
MIVLDKVTKTFRVRGEEKTVAREISAVIPTGTSVALLGRNGAGKSTLLQMIAGTQVPTSGKIWSDGTISFPVGFAGSFHPELTGAQNVLFVARIYGVETDALVEFVENFAELGRHYYMPVRTYSSGMRSRLAFGLSMGIRFDTYLVDEVTSVGDAGFKVKSEALFMERMSQSGAIVVSHSMEFVKRICNLAIVLENGEIQTYEDVSEGVARHLKNMNV